MSAPPRTVLVAGPGEAAAIRAVVQTGDVGTLGVPGLALARQRDVAELVALLRDRAVAAPIYDLPAPITEASVAAWIAEAEAQRARGEALLMVIRSQAGPVIGFAKITVWPERASAELEGALRSDHQSAGTGTVQFHSAIAWMFTTLRVRLIGLTAALDNLRSARLIDSAGFARAGERIAVRGDGSERRSLYWELTRDDWRAYQDRRGHHGRAAAGG